MDTKDLRTRIVLVLVVAIEHADLEAGIDYDYEEEGRI